jgi:hypothetical protein
MFRAVNTETEYERKRTQVERLKIKNVYISAVKTLNIEKYFELKVQFEQNQGFYLAGKSNLLYNLVRRSPLKNMDELIKKHNILESKLAFFEFVKKCIDNGLFVKAKKLLNCARIKGWICNDLFDFENQIEETYFKGQKMKKRCKFEDFI